MEFDKNVRVESYEKKYLGDGEHKQVVLTYRAPSLIAPQAAKTNK